MAALLKSLMGKGFGGIHGMLEHAQMMPILADDRRVNPPSGHVGAP
jgi:hypothetical protein